MATVTKVHVAILLAMIEIRHVLDWKDAGIPRSVVEAIANYFSSNQGRGIVTFMIRSGFITVTDDRLKIAIAIPDPDRCPGEEPNALPPGWIKRVKAHLEAKQPIDLTRRSRNETDVPEPANEKAHFTVRARRAKKGAAS